MSTYVVNGFFKKLPPNPKSTVGLTLFKKHLKTDLDELNVPYVDSCCLEGETIFTVRNNAGTLETLNSAGAWVTFNTGTYYPSVAQNDIAAGTGGAILVTNYLTTINTDAGGDAFTLANGTVVGQMKKILLVVDGGGDGVVTPATAFFGGATTATFGDATDYLILRWNGTAWVVLENFGVTVA
jgi:hypothetical protein